ncbi:MAG: hypothetical protein MRZ54_12495 [Clostridiales bacterium]|nr:hypothetical protein [Clostridiales bacterium]
MEVRIWQFVMFATENATVLYVPELEKLTLTHILLPGIRVKTVTESQYAMLAMEQESAVNVVALVKCESCKVEFDSVCYSK